VTASRRRCVLLLFLLAVAAGCASPAAPPVGSPIEQAPRLSAPVPDEADRTARDLAAALLRSDVAAAARAADALEAIDSERAARGEPRAGLAAYGRDAQTALLPKARERREAQQLVLGRNDVPKELETRLAQDVADDPLALAKKRLREDRLVRWGGPANELAEASGGSLTAPIMLPLRMTQALVRVALNSHDEDDLTPRQRQALKHWKDFVEQNPEAPQAVELLDRIEEAQLRWTDLQARKAVRQGERALAANEPILAAFLAERALRFRPEDARAIALLNTASERGSAWNQDRARTLTVAGGAASLSDAEGRLARAFLAREGLEDAARAVLAEGPAASPTGAAAAEWGLAIAARERNAEREEWERFGALAAGPSAMARHAQALVASLDANPYGGFQRAVRQKRGENAKLVLFGPLANGAEDHDLPRPVEWLAELPTLTNVVLGLPSRLLAFPYGRSEKRAAAELARRYLEEHPDGAHAAEMRAWLREYEDTRGNAIAAYELAEGDASVSEREHAKLRERAAEQMVKAADKEKSRVGRVTLLAQAAQRFPGEKATAGVEERIRKEIERATPQHIRISKGYLLENPVVAGPQALALAPGLLDGELSNGELHDEGVALIGGRWIEVSSVSKEGPDAEPLRERIELTDEHLARLVAVLEESALRRTRVDHDARFAQDAARETFFERARLGLADEHVRAGGDSEFGFTGMRETYGLVRYRDSVLPVELVLQSGLANYGFGAFPRIRMPRPTADQVLYR
jgi:hypothetical protein